MSSVIVTGKWGGTTGGSFSGNTIKVGGTPLDETWICMLTGVWGQLTDFDSVGVKVLSGSWEVFVETHSGNSTGVYASVACAKSLTQGPEYITPLDYYYGTSVYPWGGSEACGLSVIDNGGSSWNSSSSFVRLSEDASHTGWEVDGSSDVRYGEAACATLASSGHLSGVAITSGSTTITPNGGAGGALCGLTWIQGNFAGNTNPNAGVFLTPNSPSAGVWTLNVSSGFSGAQADCWW